MFVYAFVHAGVLPADLPEPPTAALTGSHSSPGRRMRPVPASGRASGAGRTIARRRILRSSVSGRRAAGSRVRTVAASRCDRSRRATGIGRAPAAPDVQARARHHAARIRGRLPHRQAEVGLAIRQRCRRRRVRGGLRVFGSRVYERAAAVLGMTPARYAARAKGETVRYTIARCSVGHVLVAATPRGICSVAIGSDPAALERGLRSEFSEADARARRMAVLSSAVKAIVGEHRGTARRIRGSRWTSGRRHFRRGCGANFSEFRAAPRAATRRSRAESGGPAPHVRSPEHARPIRWH